VPYHETARVGDGANGAVLVIGVGDSLGYIGRAVDGALLGEHVALGVIAPGRGAGAVRHAGPPPFAIRDGQAIATGLIVGVSHRQVAVGIRLARQAIVHVIGVGGGDAAGVHAAANIPGVARAKRPSRGSVIEIGDYPLDKSLKR